MFDLYFCQNRTQNISKMYENQEFIVMECRFQMLNKVLDARSLMLDARFTEIEHARLDSMLK